MVLAKAVDFDQQLGKVRFASHFVADRGNGGEGKGVDSRVGMFTHESRTARQTERDFFYGGGRLIDASFCKLHAVALVGERGESKEEIGWLPDPAAFVHVCRYDGHPFSPHAFLSAQTQPEISK